MRKSLLLIHITVSFLYCFSIYASEPSIYSSEVSDSIMEIEFLINEGKWKEAEEVIISLMKTEPAHPRNIMLFFNLGVCQFNQGKKGDAISSFDIVLAKHPQFTNALYRRALAYMANENKESALKDLDCLLEIDSCFSDALFLRSLLLLSSGNVDKASEDLDRLLELADREPDGDTSVLAARIYREKKDYESSKEFYEKALATEPSEETYFETIIFLITEKEELETAQQLINQALKLYPSMGELFMCQAMINKKNFQNSEAETNIKIAKKYGVDSQTIEFFLK